MALAAYLGLDWLPFQQTGIERNGIMSFVQSNVIVFDDPSALPALVEKWVVARDWSPGWKNGLSFAHAPDEFQDATDQLGRTSRYFHATIRNMHRRRLAHDCVAYLERIRDVQHRRPLPLRSAELAWAGFPYPSATLIAGGERLLDLGHVDHRQPHILQFNAFSTSSQFMAPLVGPGEFDLSYVVVSDNLPPVRATCRAILTQSLATTTLREISIAS